MAQHLTHGLQRTRLRMATRIHAHVMASQRDPPDTWSYPLENLTERAKQTVILQRRLQLCRCHGFLAAFASVMAELQDHLRCMPHEIEQVTRTIPPPQIILPTLRDVIAEVDHLYDEFPEAHYDPQGRNPQRHDRPHHPGRHSPGPL